LHLVGDRRRIAERCSACDARALELHRALHLVGETTDLVQDVAPRTLLGGERLAIALAGVELELLRDGRFVRGQAQVLLECHAPLGDRDVIERLGLVAGDERIGVGKVEHARPAAMVGLVAPGLRLDVVEEREHPVIG
jgi:hypothetical protein